MKRQVIFAVTYVSIRDTDVIFMNLMFNVVELCRVVFIPIFGGVERVGCIFQSPFHSEGARNLISEIF